LSSLIFVLESLFSDKGISGAGYLSHSAVLLAKSSQPCRIWSSNEPVISSLDLLSPAALPSSSCRRLKLWDVLVLKCAESQTRLSDKEETLAEIVLENESDPVLV